MSYQRFRPTSGSRMPPGVLNLIILNVILFITTLLFNSQDFAYGVTGQSVFENKLTLHHPLSEDFHFYQYLTSMFMHANFQHILFNMFGLWIFGAMVENAYGTKRFIIFYLICGVGASLIYQGWQSFEQYNAVIDFYASNGDSRAGLGFIEALQMHPPMGSLLGASGAVFGVLMGAALLFPNTEMYMMFIPIPVKLKWLAVLYGGAELYNSWQMNPADNVAHFAHLGGMIFAFILVKIYARSKTNFY
ncbi:MAG: rhomboid family intramembrane serine protease [Bacteroidia bacterium]